MMPISFCVYGSSSAKTKQAYLDASFETGAELGRLGHVCINGGGATGCMGSINKGCRSSNGSVIGVIHDMFVVDGNCDPLVTDMLISTGDDLTERKRLLRDNADCIIILPGGVGTFDELWETVAAKSLKFTGLDKVPICILNVDGFFDGFITQLHRAELDGLLYGPSESYMHIETEPKAAIAWCEAELKRLLWAGSRLNRQNLVDVVANSQTLKTAADVRR